METKERRRKKKERKKRGKARADVQVRKRGRRREEARRGQKRVRGGEGWGRVEGIYIQRDQGEIEIETSGTTMAVEIRQGGGREGNEGIRSCDCTKFAVRTAASFRRDRNMHW